MSRKAAGSYMTPFDCRLRFLRIDPGTVSVASQTDPVVAKNRPDQWSVIFRSFQFGLRLSCCTQISALDLLKRYVR
ncbi:unnamed protein product [Cladocopium goreaui]|uniref:Uncharacterized protein n=1 Tax=Cladocopium goreaui TaxID=2562237 RepID=A0A9P1FXN5_9DINO|nr:unnamed protein product [Cladocopium goreaui]